MTAAETKYTMAQLRASKKSLFVKNESEFLWKLSELGLELRPRGQRGSIAHLSHEALDNANVLRNYSKGAISISPDYEDEMFALESGESPNVVESVLKGVDEVKDFQVLPSHERNSIDAKDKALGYLNSQNRKRVTPQGQELGGNVEEFMDPGFIRMADITVDPKSGEITEDSSAALDVRNLKYTIERKVSN